MKTYNEFEKAVSELFPEAYFDAKKEELKRIKFEDYEIFLKLVKLGGNIDACSYICRFLGQLNIRTHLTKSELVELMNQFRLPLSLLGDENYEKPSSRPKLLLNEINLEKNYSINLKDDIKPVRRRKIEFVFSIGVVGHGDFKNYLKEHGGIDEHKIINDVLAGKLEIIGKE